MDSWRSSSSALLCWVTFATLSLAVHFGSLGANFVSDDSFYFANPYLMELSGDNLRAIVDPSGEPSSMTANYAPVHLLLTALQIQIFELDPTPYHVVNTLVHALNATLLVGLLLASGLAAIPAVIGGLLFLFHPANVEVVQWISQLKTSAALAFGLGALFALRRHPAWATLLFALALLTKASAAFALPMAAALVWVRATSAEAKGSSWAWLAGWALLLVLYSIPQLAAFESTNRAMIPGYADPLVHLRSIASVGAHYLAMAATSWGLAYGGEHAPVTSALDPWWLAAIPAAVLLTWRVVVTLRRRSEEAAYWIGAAAAFIPVSQIFPFSHPIGDRYLYMILPGLIGGTLFVVRDISTALRARIRSEEVLHRLGQAAIAAGIALVVFFGVHSAERANLWNEPFRLYRDSAQRYPDGRHAHYRSALYAIGDGNAERAVSALRLAADRGHNQFALLLNDPALEPLRTHPEFRALIYDLAGHFLEAQKSRDSLTPGDLAMVSWAHIERGELDEAEKALEAALAGGERYREELAAQMEGLRQMRAELQRMGLESVRPPLALPPD